MLVCLVCHAAQAAPLRVSLVNPGGSKEVFWQMVDRYALEAAAELDIELEIVHAERNHLQMVRLAEQIAAGPTPPDALVVVNERSMGPAMLRAADSANVPVFLLLNDLSAEQQTELGEPGERLGSWVGFLGPDNVGAGRLIAQALVQAAEHAPGCARDEHGHLLMVAINGDRVTPAAIDRAKGLRLHLATARHVHLAQEVFGDWRRDRARAIAEVLLARYPDVCLVWAANDEMALGVTDAALAAGRVLGRDLLVAGLNGSAAAVVAVRDGRLVATVAGHFTLGGALMHEIRRRADAGVLHEPQPSMRWAVFAPVTELATARYDAWVRQGWSAVVLEDLKRGAPWPASGALEVAFPGAATESASWLTVPTWMIVP